VTIREKLEDLNADVPSVGSWSRRLAEALGNADSVSGSWEKKALAGENPAKLSGSWRARLKRAIELDLIDGGINPYRALVLRSSPEAYWRFEDDTLVDETSNHTANEATYQPVPGLIGKAGRFHGTTDHCRVDSLATRCAKVPVTYEFWFKTTVNNTWGGRVLDANLSASRYYHRSVALYGSLIYSQVRDTKNDGIGGSTHELYSNTPEPTFDGEWHHVAVVFSPTWTQHWYDGELIGSNEQALDLESSMDVLTIGAQNFGPNGTNAFFRGDLDEVAVYRSALTQEKIEEHYSVGRQSVT
jgi:hypothetical protein